MQPAACRAQQTALYLHIGLPSPTACIAATKLWLQQLSSHQVGKVKSPAIMRRSICVGSGRGQLVVDQSLVSAKPMQSKAALLSAKQLHGWGSCFQPVNCRIGARLSDTQ